ncbi:MAG: exported protein of unknown function [Nitrospira sp.]|jgi:hypothetical protein|nr:exported protein of unknown function [Nitrospira sp.]
MNWNSLQPTVRLVLPVSCALVLLCGGTALAGETWIHDVWNMVIFEKANYPTSDFSPYLQKLDRIRAGLERDNQQVAKMETDRFLKMLLDRRHGINDVAADEIYNFVLSVRPNGSNESTALSAPIELGINTERPISVPDFSVNTPYEGGPLCGSGGCDYWSNDVFDPGAS